jgi:predicted DNA-binding transcriptional regulator AlpA
LAATEKCILNTREIGELIGRSPPAIRNLVLRRAIPYRKVAGRLIFLREEILKWIEDAPGVRPEDLESK